MQFYNYQEETKEDEDEPWLFYCFRGTNPSEVKNILKFNNELAKLIVLDSLNWTCEVSLIIDK